jgi:arginyl-tRNA synthetase
MSTITSAELETLLGELGLNTPIPSFSEADVLNKPLDIARCYLADVVAKLVDCDAHTAYSSIQWPNNIYNGDLCVVLPKLKLGADSKTLAFDLQTKVITSSHCETLPFRDCVTKEETTEPNTLCQFSCPLFVLPFLDGVHLRVMFNPYALQRLLLPYISSRNQSYGLDTSLGLHEPASLSPKPKSLVVEFSSPNIASKFQLKHLRSTILGAQIANLHVAMGWNVTKLSYLGDWGKPIGLLGVGWEKNGSEELFHSDPVGHLHDIYEKISELFAPEQAASKKARNESGDTAAAEVEAQGLFAERNAFFKRLEGREATAIAFWERTRKFCIQDYTEHYTRLNVTFDEYSGESQVSQATMREVESILKDKDLLQESGGASMIDMKKHGGKAGTVIIRDRDGSDTYTLRDLAAVVERSRKYSFDKMIYVVAADHTMHFSNLFKILMLMDMSDLAAKLQHVSFSTGSKVSANADMLGGAIDQCQASMRESLNAELEKAALLGHTEAAFSAIGVNALLAQELSAKRANDHPYDINHMTSFESGTGPDLQYWYARLCLVLNTASNSEELATLKISGHGRQDSGLGSGMEKVEEIKDEDQITLLRLLIQYPDVTQVAYNTLEPSILVGYLVAVTEQLSDCFEESKERDSSNGILMLGHKKLYEAARQVLENGMKLLGLALFVK